MKSKPKAFLKQIGTNFCAHTADGMPIVKPGTRVIWYFNGKGEAEKNLKRYGYLPRMSQAH